MKRLLFGIILALTIASLGGVMVLALEVPSAPPLDRPIVDQTKTLSTEEIDQLSTQIANERGQKSFQVGVLMIPSISDTALEDYSIQVARKWGIGEKDQNNGVLLLIAKDDHSMRIEVGSGLEGDLTDIQTGHIIDDVLSPKFRQNDFYGGIHDGLESITALIEGTADPHPAPKQSGLQAFWNILANGSVFFIFIILWVTSILARTKSWYAGGILGAIAGIILCIFIGWTLLTIISILGLILGGLGLDWLVSRNYQQHKGAGSSPAWWAGGTNFGGGGPSGGGGGFGGGGFSGGGASGGW